ncbi:hypothetical protein [Longitalea luteola]|uniref:hypothetical protein n=1 Tax=Longitalea luteola TaxID=2812563 RepID=UPI001A97778C|nr:hypothetical protein [Longitalea luteola]
MKQFLVNCWPVLLLAVLLASCGKEVSNNDDISQYYIKCKIGSTDKTFNFSPAAVKQDLGGGVMNYSIFGKASNDPADLESMDFTIQLAIPIARGTYKETDPTSDYFLMGTYNPNTTISDNIFVNQGDEHNPFEITFTEISSTTLSGTFKGKLYLNNTSAKPDSAVISNGQFKVKIQ